MREIRFILLAIVSMAVIPCISFGCAPDPTALAGTVGVIGVAVASLIFLVAWLGRWTKTDEAQLARSRLQGVWLAVVGVAIYSAIMFQSGLSFLWLFICGAFTFVAAILYLAEHWPDGCEGRWSHEDK